MTDSCERQPCNPPLDRHEQQPTLFMHPPGRCAPWPAVRAAVGVLFGSSTPLDRRRGRPDASWHPTGVAGARWLALLGRRSAWPHGPQLPTAASSKRGCRGGGTIWGELASSRWAPTTRRPLRVSHLRTQRALTRPTAEVATRCFPPTLEQRTPSALPTVPSL